jgi:hypothetical protein
MNAGPHSQWSETPRKYQECPYELFSSDWTQDSGPVVWGPRDLNSILDIILKGNNQNELREISRGLFGS